MTAAMTAAPTAGQFRNVGTTMPMKVSASVNSRPQLAGTFAPRKMPAAVLTCQVDQSVMPVPKRNQWRVAGDSLLA